MILKSKDSIENRLDAYFQISEAVQKQNKIQKIGIPLAAGALVSLGSQVNANVIVNDIADVTLSGYGAQHPIDMNGGDGADLLVGRMPYPYMGAYVRTAGRANSALLGSFTSSIFWSAVYPFALNSGQNITPGGSWNYTSYGYGTLTMLTETIGGTNTIGNWKNKFNKYLGVRFMIGSNTHYGWVELSVNNASSSVTIHQYAYEDTPGLGIKAGSDVSLPVEFSELVAVQENGKVKLSWTTESEIDNLGFILERKSKNTDWIEIASYMTYDALKGGGNTSSKSEYVFVDDNVFPYETYSYRLSDVSTDGTRKVKDVISITLDEMPLITDLLPASPNPFNPSTKIQYQLAKDSDVTLKVVNMTGQTVQTIISDQQQTAGSYSVHWNGKNESGINAPSGIYLLVLNSGQLIKTQKVMLVR